MPRSRRPHLLARNPLILSVSTAMLLSGALPVAAAPGSHETTRSNRGTVANTGSGALESAVNYSSSRSNRPSSIDTESGDGALFAVSYSSSRSNRPSVTCNDGAIVACFEGSVQVSCAGDAGALRPKVAGVEGGACATHGGVREVSVQPYDFICAMPDAEVYAKDGSDIFLKACEVQEVCLDGGDNCEAAQTLSLVAAFPDITVAQLHEDNVGLAVVAELDRMLRHLSDLETRGGPGHLDVAPTVKPISVTISASSSEPSGSVDLRDDFAKISAASTDDLNAALTLVCADEAELAHEAAHIVQQANGLTRSDGGGGGCTPTLSDLIKDWPFAAANGGTAGDQQLMVADFRDAAALELSDEDQTIAKISADVADASISYWDSSEQLTAFPEAELKGTAVGAAQASTLDRTSMLLHAVRGGVQAGLDACLETGDNDARYLKTRCGR